jgi:NAD(P)-dependent dehydrogenase (short-subunit alcohol dehydrogenase family)
VTGIFESMLVSRPSKNLLPECGRASFLMRWTVVAPGSILTPLLRRAQEVNPEEGTNSPTAIKRPGTAEEIASIIVFLLGPESTYVTGSIYSGDGGWNC